MKNEPIFEFFSGEFEFILCINEFLISFKNNERLETILYIKEDDLSHIGFLFKNIKENEERSLVMFFYEVILCEIERKLRFVKNRKDRTAEWLWPEQERAFHAYINSASMFESLSENDKKYISRIKYYFYFMLLDQIQNNKEEFKSNPIYIGIEQQIEKLKDLEKIALDYIGSTSLPNLTNYYLDQEKNLYEFIKKGTVMNSDKLVISPKQYERNISIGVALGKTIILPSNKCTITNFRDISIGKEFFYNDNRYIKIDNAFMMMETSKAYEIKEGNKKIRPNAVCLSNKECSFFFFAGKTPCETPYLDNTERTTVFKDVPIAAIFMINDHYDEGVYLKTIEKERFNAVNCKYGNLDFFNDNAKCIVFPKAVMKIKG